MNDKRLDEVIELCAKPLVKTEAHRLEALAELKK